MVKKLLYILCAAAMLSIVFQQCGIDTASGPTPYEVKYDSTQYWRDQYVKMGFGMFIHFNMSTYSRWNVAAPDAKGEWGDPNSPDTLFHPGKLDCGQWADVAKSAGCKYVVLTTKHHDGFCLWDSRYTTHDVGSSNWAGGRRNVAKEFADSARSRGLKVGFYYSILDWRNGYATDFILNQLAELLDTATYGELACLWFDGWGWMVGYRLVPPKPVSDLMKRLQPHCLFIDNSYTFKLNPSDLVEWEIPIWGMPQVGNTLPAEGCQTLRLDKCWFWHTVRECDLMPAQTVVNEIQDMNSRNAAYLLDVAPDTSGLIPQCQADRMAEIGRMLKQTGGCRP